MATSQQPGQVVEEGADLDAAASPARHLARNDSLDLEAGRLKDWSPHKVLSTGIILRLAYQSIGVVYGDVGTSPLYVFATAFPDGLTGDPHFKQNVLGALSLVIYTLTLIPLLKYVNVVIKANDDGEGGTFALYSLICRFAKVGLVGNHNYEDRELSTFSLSLPSRNKKISGWLKEKLEGSERLKKGLLIIVLLATSLIIGDGVLTPSISVLSAISGLQVNSETNVSKGVVVWVSVVVLILLFLLQHKGTDKVGFLFAPAVVLWFVCNVLIGVYNIVKYDPSVFKAFNPYYMYAYFRNNKRDGWIHLGGIVLAITGTEAMFADIGHFSVPSIQIAFTFFVYPSLLITYTGQAAYLMKHPENVAETFYKSIPKPVYWPMFAIATAAAIIASQAMISAAFSIVHQSMALSCFPTVKVIHTSKRFPGQIYIPEVNWVLMILCLLVTAGFQDTVKIGNAYGIAVVGVMVITTCLVTLVMLLIWQTNLFSALLYLFLFGSIEAIYLSSVLYKVPQGGWVPLAFAVFFLTLMYVWHYVHVQKYQYEVQNKISLEWVTGLGSSLGMLRVPGIGLVYSELAQGVPAIFSHLITNLPAIHSTLVFVCVKHLPVWHVPEEERFLVRRLGPKEYRMYRCAVRYGYRDLETENHHEFEQKLVKSLSEFLQAEASLDADQYLPQLGSGQSEGDSEVAHSRIPSSGPQSVSGQSSDSPFSEGQVLFQARNGDVVYKATGPEAALVQEELVCLQEAKQAGVVYVLGSVDLKARPGSSWLRRFVINELFSFIRRNFRASREALHIPYGSLLQVGMTNQV